MSERKVSLCDIIIEDEIIWALANDYNGLFQGNCKTGEFEYLGNPGSGRRIPMFSSMVKINEYIILAPASEEKIVIYQITNKKFEEIPIPKPRFITERYQKYHEWGNFSIIRWKSYAFLIGMYYPAILRLNMEDRSIDYMDSWVNEIEKNASDDGMYYFRNSHVIKNNYLYIPVNIINVVLEVNLNNLDCKWHYIGSDAVGFSGICMIDDDFYISARDTRKVIKWNIQNKKHYDYMLNKFYPDNNIKASVSFLHYDGESLWYFPINSTTVLKKRRDSNEWEKDLFLKQYAEESNIYKHIWKQTYSFAKLCNNNFWIFLGSKMTLINYDYNNKRINEYCIKEPLEEKRNRFKNNDNLIVIEGKGKRGDYFLADMIEELAVGDIDLSTNKQEQDLRTSGALIHEHIIIQ